MTKSDWAKKTNKPQTKKEDKPKEKKATKKRKVKEEVEEKHYQDFLKTKKYVDFSYTPEKEPEEGSMYLFYGDSGAGKSFVSGTWFDNECLGCRAKIISPERGKIKKCPLCQSEKIQKRPIVSIDFELGRGEKLRKGQFPNKNYVIIEPRILKDDWNPMEDDDSTDVIASLEKFIDALLAIWKDVKSGLIFPSVIVVDSATDVWGIVQEWGIQELVRYHPKYTKKNAKMMRTETQIDWKVPNNRHFKLIQICRTIMNFGIDIVWTARYEGPPDYVKDGTQKIRAQKDVSFFSDMRIHMERRTVGKKNFFTSHFEKLADLEPPTEPFDRINYIKIQNILKEAKVKRDEKLSEEVEAILI